MRKRRVYVFAAVAIFAAAAYVLGWSTLFTVSAVEFKGTDTELRALVVPGEKLARIEPRTVIAQYKKLEWVKNVEVSRNWINGKVTITVKKRVPIAIFKDRAIDDEGISFPIPDHGTSGLPVIQGPNLSSALAASKFFTSLPIEISQIVDVVKIRRGDVYVLEIKWGEKSLEVLWGQSKDNALKANVYKALTLRAENSDIRRIDLTAPHAPIVK
ncbi:unannotated protein [freshwater metagenome]|uniref:Unannotated protein n=1 Tax=freshwater metagenome TaxID=449393 RepID=A0A6J7HE20_9ZZZZ|nr:FtsQ-type POTRA domain-containing protein [Actinomycetota bacterium]